MQVQLQKNIGNKKNTGSKKNQGKKKATCVAKNIGNKKIMQVCLRCACASCIAHIRYMRVLQGSLRACLIHRIFSTFLHYSPQLTLAQFNPQNTIHNIQHVSHSKDYSSEFILALICVFSQPIEPRKILV